MSKVIFSENMFIDTNELNRFKLFLEDEGYKKIFKSIISNYGIIRNESNSNFKTSIVNNTTISISGGLALTKDIKMIYSESNVNLILTQNSNPNWVILSYAETDKEKGTVSISKNGMLIGTNTELTKVLRGQPNFPVKVKLSSSTNTSEYEVLKVIDDYNAILTGNFIPESNLKLSVIGTFTPGFQPSEQNKFIYSYDSFNIQVINSAEHPLLNDNQFLLSKCYYSSGNIVLEDKRSGSYLNETKLESNLFNNLFSTLTRVNRILENNIELIVCHGYKINSFVKNNDNLQITSGYSNSYPGNVASDNLFKNFLLYNLKNMKCSKISRNAGNFVYFYDFDSFMFTGSEDDLVIVPDFSEIEYKISYSGADNSSPLYIKQQISNINSRIVIPLKYGVSTVKIEYRLIHDYKNSTAFKELTIANFINMSGLSETLSGSDFSVNLVSTNSQENYS